MDDYSALAQRISLNVREVRGCLLLSRDGLVLGAYPVGEEGDAKTAWLRFCALGEPERSFVEFTDQVWAFVHRGPYGAFAVADVGVRPGILVDQLERLLMTADEERSRRDTLRVPEATAAPSGKPRTSLHPPAVKPPAPSERVEASVATAPEVLPAVADAVPEAPPERRNSFPERKDSFLAPQPVADPVPEALTVAEADAAAAAIGSADPGPIAGQMPAAAPMPSEAPAHAEPPSDLPHQGTSHLGKEPMKLVGGAGTPPEEEVEVDRVLLAKEFSGLLQVDMGDDEASS
jgi:hypothetical protein